MAPSSNEKVSRMPRWSNVALRVMCKENGVRGRSRRATSGRALRLGDRLSSTVPPHTGNPRLRYLAQGAREGVALLRAASSAPGGV